MASNIDILLNYTSQKREFSMVGMRNCHHRKSPLHLTGLKQEVLIFYRLKTDGASRVYLYEEHRHREGGKVKSKSRSHGRVNGFWFFMAMIMDNFGEIFRTKVNGYNPEEAELQAAQKSDEERERDKQKEWEITHPGWAAPGVPEVTPAAEVPAAPEPESAPPSESSEAPEAPEGAPDPE